jgi:heme-degrading monooxygenase HmoA
MGCQDGRMNQPRVLTSVTLVVPEHRGPEVVPAFRALAADGPRPDGLLRSELLRGQGDRWLIQTLWRDREAIMAARSSGAKPAALALAEQLGAEHSHDVLTVEEAVD